MPPHDSQSLPTESPHAVQAKLPPEDTPGAAIGPRQQAIQSSHRNDNRGRDRKQANAQAETISEGQRDPQRQDRQGKHAPHANPERDANPRKSDKRMGKRAQPQRLDQEHERDQGPNEPRCFCQRRGQERPRQDIDESDESNPGPNSTPTHDAVRCHEKDDRDDPSLDAERGHIGISCDEDE